MELTETKAVPSSVQEDDHDAVSNFPEGGFRAWLVVFGSFSALFSTWGIVNSYGVFQAQYTSEQLSNYSSSTISLIGSLQLFILYGLGPVVGKLFDLIGIRVLLPTGTFIVTLSLIILSFCQNNHAYQFFLVHGVLFAIGSALIFTPSLAIIGHWFYRKRASAIGIVASGSSIGGVVYPILVKQLIPKIGFRWTVRAIALVTLACLSISCICMRTRLPLSRKATFRHAVDFSGYRSLSYCLVTLSAFLIFYATFIPYFYIEAYANDKQVPPRLVSYLVAILNASGVCRVLLGFIADRIGTLNVLVPSVWLSGIITFCLWLPADGPIPITIFCATFGFLSGSLLSLLPAYIASISSNHNFGGRLGQ